MTRAQAKYLGLKHYFTGKPCKHGHVAKRKTVNGTCFACERVLVEKWKTKNYPRHLELMRGWSRRNPEKRRIHVQRTRANNPDWRQKLNAAVAEWARRNKDRRCASEQKRRARKQRASGAGYSVQDIARLLILQNGKCVYCSVSFSESVRHTVDHVTPLSKGGAHDLQNIVLACGPCNSRKGARSVEAVFRRTTR